MDLVGNIAFQAAPILLASPIVSLVFLSMWMIFVVLLLVFLMLARGPAMQFIKAKVRGAKTEWHQ